MWTMTIKMPAIILHDRPTKYRHHMHLETVAARGAAYET